MLLLDTNVVSELRKSSPHGSLARWAESTRKNEAFLSVVTIREIEAGILLVERHDPQQGARLRTWLETHVLVEYADRILAADLPAARRAAALHVPDPRPERDALVAATALTHGLTVVTRNVRDFVPLGLDVLDPWQAPPSEPDVR